MNASEYREYIAKTIKSGENLTFIKAGDGERNCIWGQNGHNCDGHSYSEMLGIELLNVYAYFSKEHGVTITQFPYMSKFLPTDPKIQIYESLLFMEQNLDESFFNLWKTIRQTKRKKHFIGNESVFTEIKEALKIDNHIKIVEKNAYFVNTNINAKEKIGYNDIVLVSAGFIGKILAKEIHNVLEGQVTILDTGSAFDPLVRNTRLGQLSHEMAKDVLKVIMQ